MPLQHYIPAAYLGNFSHQTTGMRRNRMLYVGDKKKHSVFTAPARTIMAENDFYKGFLEVNDPNFLDNILSSHESKLLPTIDLLINDNLDCQQWFVLIRFVTSLLVRGPDFNRRFENREIIKHLSEMLPQDNTNRARLLEYQRLLAPIIGASWRVLTITAYDEIITNDVGYVPSYDPHDHRPGIAIPLNLHHILLLIPSLKRNIAIGHNGVWKPIIEFGFLDGAAVKDFNEVAYSNAIRFIAGSEKAIVQNLITLNPPTQGAMEPAFLGFFSGDMARVFEHMDYNFLNTISDPPQNEGDFLFVDFEKNYQEFLKHEAEMKKVQPGS